MLALLGALAMEREAAAFCGFYVSGGGAKLFNNATQVVLMREGTKTVLSMQNNYQGPPEKFAMVVPVPVVLQQDSVKTLPAALFDRIDKLSAPRLVEYWEQDPCPVPEDGQVFGHGSGMGTGMGFGSGHGRLGGGTEVEVLAQFAVGEYEVVILGASDSMALDGWLRQNGYQIPPGAEPHLRPYVQAGSKFFVAKVDPTKVTFKDGQAKLSPLRFHYDSDTFSLPIRLGLINAGEAQDLIVNIIAKNTRYEAANYPNAAVPTNLDVNDETKEGFGAFYTALFDRTLAQQPRAVVTEYAWDSNTCDPCPEPALDGQELVTLGADVLPLPPLKGSRSGAPPQVRMGATTVKGRLPPEVIQRIVRQSFGRFRLCYENGLRNRPDLEGRVSVQFTIDRNGAVAKVAKAPDTTLPDKTVVDCVTRSFSGLSFPMPEGGAVEVTYPITFSPPSSQAAATKFVNPGGFILTRLHARYRKDGLADDLVFRPAPAIMGGRETRDEQGNLEQGARASEINMFQARYAVRHPWEGKIACEKPRRGVWGGPPAGSSTSAPRPATDLAFAPRGVPLTRFVSALPGPSPIPTSSAPAALSSSPGSAQAPDSPAARTAGRCGCRLPGGDEPGSSLPLLGVALSVVALRRRAASRRVRPGRESVASPDLTSRR